MWAVRPAYHDNDAPMDLRKKVVLERNIEESRNSSSVLLAKNTTHQYKKNWHQPPILPVASLYPFVSERYGGQCSIVSPDENRVHDIRHGSRGSLETAIRKLHHNRQLKRVYESPRTKRSRSADATSDNGKSALNIKRPPRSSSCPNFTIIKPAPVKSRSPIKPKSYFIQRSSGHLFDSDSNSNSIANSYHRTYESYRANSPVTGGAKKRKSFVPVYGDRCVSPKRIYDDPVSPPRRFYDDRTSSPRESYLDRPLSPKRRAISPDPPPEEYYPHSEVLLRRQLQQHTPPAYLVHVYDYYQQLVQRLREQHSPGVRLPPPMSPSSVEDDMQPDSQRKRPCRALTGKHVRQGTGASLTTLLTLRQKIQERQKAKEHEPHNGFNGSSNKTMLQKKNKPQKIKPVMKNMLSRVQHC
ncbi:uncharacterized protein [Parasteatoda tepidariorum]|uniref:uncharacterized protein n=1 Tax=Parasteatoda tepidariorum TaxID=114398 RepID=UPI001C728DD4|nr:uncharacterized protein LOC107449895 [Parasteatoda tepidariorum]XP_042899614.1 uncharacterized protein LOC107449895 [Parasteatoda tepidariorum]XP_042899616.1 uncharacterized protein LOC107449895 [Parasteatoda tepidariorum]XP_042899617.1 uncharacterized protein LOC107449895 [Parasteatoda tepidariorum]XP_042899618.1 uncharacterized protein LOC107449895 [Parasteatoda tepidariorum]XP_042899619.1 uncharacterized protein LOC107449895 [Parasteatoda tepidariorum]